MLIGDTLNISDLTKTGKNKIMYLILVEFLILMNVRLIL